MDLRSVALGPSVVRTIKRYWEQECIFVNHHIIFFDFELKK